MSGRFKIEPSQVQSNQDERHASDGLATKGQKGTGATVYVCSDVHDLTRSCSKE